MPNNRLAVDFTFKNQRITKHAHVLTHEDWLQIHWFMKEVYLPFMNRVVDKAYARAENPNPAP